MSSDYEFSDDDGEYYDDEEMLDGTQDDEGWLFDSSSCRPGY
jgi:ariadne-1